MPFFLPTFNLHCNVWRYNHDPRSTLPDLAAQACNLQFAPKHAFFGEFYVAGGTLAAFQAGLANYAWARYLLLPAGSDVRPTWWNLHTSGTQGDWIECPAGSGRFYVCVDVDDVGKGFANEYRTAAIVPYPPWPTPIP